MECSQSEALTSSPRQGLSLFWSKDVMAQFICFVDVRSFLSTFWMVFGLSASHSATRGLSYIVNAPPAAVLETLVSCKTALHLSRKESAYLGLLSKICCGFMPRCSLSSSASSSSLDEISANKLNWCACFLSLPRILRPSWSFCVWDQPTSEALCKTMALSSDILRR